MSTLSDMLTFLRKRAGLSQQDLADKLEISRSAIGMYETGRREPDLETLEAFADFYNVDMNTLTGNSVSINKSSDEELKFALWGGDAERITPAQVEEVKNFAKFVKERDKQNG